MADRDLDRVLRVAKKAAEAAGEFIRETRRGGEFEVTYKGEVDLLTTADLGAEKIILETITNEFPGDMILSEEASPTLRSKEDYLEPLWIVDPVDGTTNFAQGHHHVGISIGFAIGGKAQVGVVAAPFVDETFWAVRGQGAWLNGKPIRTSQATDLKRALICTGFPYARDNLKPLMIRVERVLETCRDLRRLGAASVDLCWVGCGRLEGFYETLAPWDVAAGRLIAAEAGARVGHIYGVPDDAIIPADLYAENLIAACPGIYDALLAQLKLERD